MRRLFAYAIVAIALATAALAQENNSARGFNSETAYQRGDVDHINIFNGNLIVSIPIGDTYRVGGDLSYGLTLVYNGQLWSFRQINDTSNMQAVPAHYANVATGWQLSLGSLTAPEWTPFGDDQEIDRHWSFTGPDGAQHTFYRVLHPEEMNTPYEAAAGLLGYTRDGTYMRLTAGEWESVVVINGQTHWAAKVMVEMPNGIIYKFRSKQTISSAVQPTEGVPDDSQYFLESIYDRFGNTLKLEYWRNNAQVFFEPQTALLIKLLELPKGSGNVATRTQQIVLQDVDWFRTNDSSNVERRPMVRSVELTAPPDEAGTTRKAIYTFGAPFTRVAEPPESRGLFTNLTDRTMWTPLLKSVGLPDGTTYTMQYNEMTSPLTATLDYAAHMKSIKLPTGSSVEYDSEKRWFPHSPEDEEKTLGTLPPQRESQTPFNDSVAVKKRTLKNRAGQVVGVWTYSTHYDYPSPPQFGQTISRAYQQMAIAVDNPLGERTIHYFSADQYDGDNPGVYEGTELHYGLPMTFATSKKWVEEGVTGYYLSTETVAPGCGTVNDGGLNEFTFCEDKVMRRTYVKYDAEPYLSTPYDGGSAGNARMVGTISVTRKLTDAINNKWSDDLCGSLVCYTKVESGEFDGLGHFRTQTRSTNMGGATRTTKTNYDAPAYSNPGVAHTPATYTLPTGSHNVPANYMVLPSKPWLLHMYDHTSVTEGGTTNVTSRVCWEPTTAFVTRRLSIRDAATASLSTFSHLGNGNLETEAHRPASGAWTCTSALPAAEYVIKHEWSNGVLSRSWYPSFSGFNIHRVDVDPDSGLVVASYDRQNRKTVYRYDVMGRIEKVIPPGSAYTEYDYDLAANPPRISVKQFPAGGGASLTESWSYYDDFGRLVQEKRRMPAGWSTVGRRYDAAGRKEAVTTPKFESTSAYNNNFTAPETKFKYDSLGRVTLVTQPDDETVRTAYVGAREVSRTVDVAMTVASTNETPVTTTETLDGFGRLVKVTEQITNGITTYEYDIGDRLKTVKMGNGAQTRTFTYDLSGLLDKEDPPESALIDYSYDSRGHVTAKTIGTTVALAFDYDDAERLKTITDTKTGKLLKELTYDTDGSTTEQGSLVRQKRNNHFPGNVTYSVTDAFTFDAAGRIASKATQVHHGATLLDSFTQGYDYTDLGAPYSVKFPLCLTCGGVAQTNARNLALSYRDGLLTGIAGVTAPIPADPTGSGISYTAAGGVYRVQHAKTGGVGVLDTYEPDPDGMPRIQSITFDKAIDCALMTNEPNDARITSGTTTTLTVIGVSGATVKWYRGVQGDTSALLETDTISSTGTASYTTVALTQDTRYWALVTLAGAACEARTRTIVVSVCQPAAITSAPASATITLTLGKSIPFYAEATGSDVVYQWFWNDVAKGFGQAHTFTPAIAGTYVIKVRATASCGSPVTQTVATVVVASPTCVASFENPLPARHVVPNPGYNGYLDVALAAVPDAGATYKFEWRVDGQLVGSQSGASRISQQALAVHAVDKIVEVTGWIACNGQETPKVTTRTVATVHGRCSPPTVEVIPGAHVYDATQSTVTFTADVPQSPVTYQWYRYESGNTYMKIPEGITKTLTVETKPGTYWLRVTNECGLTVDSPTVTVSSQSCTPMRVVQDLQDREIVAGTEITMAIDVTSTTPATGYQWHRSPSSQIMGATQRTYTVRPIKTTDYWVAARTTCGGVEHHTFSRKARIHVTSCADINILAQPNDASVSGATAAVLSVNATASAPLRYQWYHGESGDTTTKVDRPTATSATLNYTSPSDGKVWVRMYFDDPARCAVDSRAVTVTVCSLPDIDPLPTQPISRVPGTRHLLSVTATGKRLSYAWFRGPLNDESNRLSSTSEIMSVDPVQTTKYWVKVTSDCGAPLSDLVDKAEITVSVCPAITTQLAAAKTEVMPGTTTTLTITATGYDKIEWYHRPSGTTGVGTLFNTTTTAASVPTPAITANTEFFARVYSANCYTESDPVDVNVCTPPTLNWSNSIDREVKPLQYQVLSILVSGTALTHTNTWYIGTSGNTSQPTSTQQNLGVQPTVTTNYWVRVLLSNGCYADSPTLTIKVCHPTITTQPAATTIIDKIANPSASAALTVVADAGPHTYQWYIGQPGDVSNPVSGATSATYNASPAADTTYWVRVTSSCSIKVDSAAANVIVCKTAQITTQPVSQTTTATATSTLHVDATGTGLAYQWYIGASGVTTTPASNQTATMLVSPDVTTDYWVKVTADCGASVNSATAKISIPPTITTQPAGGPITSGTTRTLTVAASGTQLTYQWYSLAGTTSTLITGATAASYTTLPITADSSFYCRVKSGNATVNSDTATLTVCQPRAISQSGAGTSGAEVTLSVVSPAADETFEWYQGASGVTTTPLGTGTTKKVYPLATTTYWVRTKRAGCDADSAAVTVKVCVPDITAEPQSTSVPSGTTKTLTVTATGTGPLTYQWYQGASGTTTSPISGATSASYTTPAITAPVSYWVRVSGPSSGCATYSVNSQTATVSVCEVTAITTQPSNNALAGSTSSVTLTVVADGDNLSYQWYEGASGVTTKPVGTNSSSLTIVPGTTKSYWVRVSGNCGVVNSVAALQSVPAKITVQPVGQSICNLGESVTMSVTATGGGLGYQWFRRSGTSAIWEKLTGETAATLTIPITVIPSDFTVSVTSGGLNTQSVEVSTTLNPKPTITSISKTAITGGQRLTANISSGDVGLVSFTWYQGPMGNVGASTVIGSAQTVNVTPTPPVTYWVRVTYDDTGCFSDKSTSF